MSDRPEDVRDESTGRVGPSREDAERSFWLLRLCRRAGRPAFHYFERKKPEQQLPGRFQIEPQILGNLLNGSGTIELRRELGLVRSQLQPLHPLETLFRVSGNRCRVETCRLLRILNKTQSFQRPIPHIWLPWMSRDVTQQVGILFKHHPHARRGPKLGESFCP